MTEANEPDLHPEETVDRLEEQALRTEAHDARELADRAKERDDGSTGAAFEQDMDVEDLPGQDAGGASEPAD